MTYAGRCSNIRLQLIFTITLNKIHHNTFQNIYLICQNAAFEYIWLRKLVKTLWLCKHAWRQCLPYLNPYRILLHAHALLLFTTAHSFCFNQWETSPRQSLTARALEKDGNRSGRSWQSYVQFQHMTHRQNGCKSCNRTWCSISVWVVLCVLS